MWLRYSIVSTWTYCRGSSTLMWSFYSSLVYLLLCLNFWNKFLSSIIELTSLVIFSFFCFNGTLSLKKSMSTSSPWGFTSSVGAADVGDVGPDATISIAFLVLRIWFYLNFGVNFTLISWSLVTVKYSHYWSKVCPILGSLMVPSSFINVGFMCFYYELVTVGSLSWSDM